MAHRLWSNEALPGQTAQTLPRPEDFAALMSLVPPEKVAESVTCGPDSDQHAAQVRKHLDAGIDEVYLQQIGPDMDGFFTAWEREVLPPLRQLRYILNFARLADFEPGAAGPGGGRGRGDISVGAEIAPWRSKVTDALYRPLREEPDPVRALTTAKEALARLVDEQDDQRRVLIERHGNDFSAAELDSEVGYKKLVIDLRVVEPIIVRGDDPARDFDVVDAALFSSAIPGVLHHESSDPRMLPILDALFEEKDIAALIDGGAASKVLVELAWKRVRDGKLGTRNACYLAFDCFHPQWDPRHLWLVPMTQAIQLQMVRNLPQPMWWEGEGPPVGKPKASRKSVASPMSSVMAAIQSPTSRFARWRQPLDLTLHRPGSGGSGGMTAHLLANRHATSSARHLPVVGTVRRLPAAGTGGGTDPHVTSRGRSATRARSNTTPSR